MAPLPCQNSDIHLRDEIDAVEKVLKQQQGGSRESYNILGAAAVAAFIFWSEEAEKEDKEGYLAFAR